MPPLLSVIVPAYNEENIIRDTVERLDQYLQEYLNGSESYEIFLVNDGSVDSTPEIMEDMAKEKEYIRLAHHEMNYGRGRALRTGFENVTGKYIVTLDADLSYEPYHIERLLEPLMQNRADIVLASAYHLDGTVSNVPWFRKNVSHWGNRILRMGTKAEFRTLTCVVRAYKKEVLNQLELVSDGKDIHLEILLKALMLNLIIVEVPADLKWQPTQRTTKKRGFSLKTFSRMVVQHLFFNLLFRPSLLIFIPVILLLTGMLGIIVVLIVEYLHILQVQSQGYSFLWTHLQALRSLILQAKISFFLLGGGFLFLFHFVSFAFLARQNKHYFEEIYVLLSRINNRLKQLLAKGDR